MKKIKMLLMFSLLITVTAENYAQNSNLFINEFMASNSNTIADPDYKQYSDWIEIYNAGDSSVNLIGYYLTDNLQDSTKWKINTNTTLLSKSFSGFWADDSSYKNHTNFKLSKKGGVIGLFSPRGDLIDYITYESQITDKSFGRFPDGSSSWNIFDIPTPGRANDTTKIEPIAPSPIFSIESGFSADPQIIEIKSNLDSAKIYYTLDGSVPTVNDSLYTRPIEISQTSVVRARIITNNYQPSKTITNTYFINENTKLPVFSIATNSNNFFSDEIGIYVEGTNGVLGRCSKEPKNWNQDWERPISVEFFESDKISAFKENAGIKITGGCSRLYDQKSLAIYFKKQYGVKKLNYHMFPYKQIYEFNDFILRSSAQDWWRTMFRDGMIQTLVKSKMDIDYQEYKPSIVFLNGEYWGIHNIREKMNEHYLESNHGVDPDNIDLIEISKNVNVNYGDRIAYDSLISFVSQKDMSLVENYEYIKKTVDIDEYINYQVAEIYSANGDFPGANSKLWRPKTKDGKWRWMLFDLDFGFGGNSNGQYFSNTLELVTATDGEDWPNPPWSTLLLRKLLENESFKSEFIQRFAVHIATTYEPSRVIGIIDSLKNIIAEEIPRHKARWKKSVSYGDWDDLVEIMRKFAKNRAGNVQKHLIDKFHLSGMETLIVDNNNLYGGKVILNTLEIKEPDFNISIFKDVPVHLTAIPYPGYKFIGWQGIVSDTSNSIYFKVNYFSKIVAVFEKDSLQSTNVVINEINYNSSPSFDTDDWIELYNNTDSTINISGWSFKDSDDRNSFNFAENTILNSRDYCVLTRDSSLFSSLFVNVKNIIGDFDFGLSGSGELIRLFDSNNNLVDSLTYGDKYPWAVEADGSGSTLELQHPSLDNSLPENWSASKNHGSPGTINGVYTEVGKKIDTKYPSEFILEQNYPNPFNPTTVIRYSIPLNDNHDSEIVSLIIYDILGNKVATLVNKRQEAGNYKVQFDASNLASGIYLYKLQMGKLKHSKKMILLR